MHLILDNISILNALCRKYKVGKLYAFGSILTPRFNENSDVDTIDLKSLFGRDVDLVDETAVKNPYFKEELEETKYLIYG